MDYAQFYDMEPYLLQTVRPRFVAQGSLSAFDFFCIIVWKANRAKSKIARKLLKRGYGDLEEAVRALTSGLANQSTAKDRLRYLVKEWEFWLPTASAILAVLYPDKFTVYDERVCSILGDFHKLANLSSLDTLWSGYQDYMRTVEGATPSGLTWREKDRYLWGKSRHDQLKRDLDRCFGIEQIGEL